jgi:hypothetical protein
MFFVNLTESNLEVKAFNAIKNNIHKTIAVEMITMNTKMRKFSKLLISEYTKSKNVYLHKSDKVGIEMIFLISKPSGFIQIHIRKKRKATIKVYFIEGDYCCISETYYYNGDCEYNWVKSLLFEFDDTIITYIRNGLSNKIVDVMAFIKVCLVLKTFFFSVYVDIPGYICII